ncbi:RNA ligase family protein [Aureispira anguillae]|uniref:RNA ligase domain-containing protein n=1 Tax=Aureispira anguillae TaxID=2864201 RepID=A0A916DPC1_9BACT|nr:RNA ligase family protein [Aureispira anguillae]BDS10056.1 hypothetical protein AsAng_0007610 [Aureispira anguillae]
MQSRKYGRTYHLPFSQGVSNDDKILKDWQGLLKKELLITEKLDGENTCLKSTGVFARSHAAPTRNPWAKNMWVIWDRLRDSLGDLEVFGENLYGIHSIEYQQLSYHFYVFAIREGDHWLSWEEVLFFADILDLATVPVFEMGKFTEKELKELITKRMELGSALGGDCEGFVLRNADGFSSVDFKYNVLKYVRKNHVQTDEHWTRNWKRAALWYEKPMAQRFNP